MGYDQYTVPNDCSCRTYFGCFPLGLANICPWPLVPFFQNSLENRADKITHNTFRHCRVHFLRQPFSKQLYTSWLLRRNEKQGFYSHTPHIRSLCSYTIPCRSRSLAFCISTKVYPVQCEYSLLRSVFIIKSLNFLDLKQRTTDHNKDENPQQHHDTRMDA